MSRTFADIGMGPPEEWELDFRRDCNPEREMAIWSEIAKHYAHFVEGGACRWRSGVASSACC
jgi:hypothetical protein